MTAPETIESVLSLVFALSTIAASAQWLRPRAAFGIPRGVLIMSSAVAVGAYGLATRDHPSFFLNQRYFVNLGVAFLAVVLACPEPTRGPSRGGRVAVAAVAALAVASYFNFGKFHGPRQPDRFVHGHEFAHHYVGAKYFDELGYDGLYTAYVAADREARRAFGPRDVLRDLDSRSLVAVAEAGSRIESVRLRFAERRWQQFKRDEAVLHSIVGTPHWREVLTDHGYNASPIWTLAGRSLVSLAESVNGGSAERTMLCLALIDPLLVVLMVAAIAWAFGRASAVYALIFWACNPFVSFEFTGGSFLRQDWLFCVIASVCCIRRGYLRLGGGLLAYAAGTRVFPGLFVTLCAVQLLNGRWTTGSWNVERARFTGSFAVTLAVLIVLSSVAVGDPGTWARFVSIAGKHNQGVFPSHIALRTLAGYEPEHTQKAYGGKFNSWALHKLHRLEAVRVPLLLATLVLTAAILVVFRDAGLVEGIAVSAFLPFLYLYPANYYCGYLMPALLVFGARLAFGIVLAGTCGYFFIEQYDVCHVYQSALVLIWLTWVMCESRRR